MRQVVRGNSYANGFFQKYHNDLFANHRQRRGNLRTDKTASDHKELFPAFAQGDIIFIQGILLISVNHDSHVTLSERSL